MSLAVTTCHAVRAGTCCFHSTPPSPTCTISHVVDPRFSPGLATVTIRTGHSPTVTISPALVTSPLPSPRTVINVQNTCHHPVHISTPSVNPLLAFDSDSRHYKIYYDLSKDLSAVRITDEQWCSLVVEGAPHKRFRIAFDHPALTSTIEFEGSLTVEDLLNELHSHFRKRPRPREMSELKKDMHLYQMTIQTQVKRCQTAFDPHAEWDQGLERVDFLGRECKFRGIYLDASPTSDHLTLRVVFGK